MGWLNKVFCGVKWALGYEEEEEYTKNKPVAFTASPFVTHKQSSQFIDDDGDVAGEFYEEVTPEHGRPWMKKITDHLTWEGLVKLEIPRLNFEFPIAMCCKN